jgi:hypothetical protein
MGAYYRAYYCPITELALTSTVLFPLIRNSDNGEREHDFAVLIGHLINKTKAFLKTPYEERTFYASEKYPSPFSNNQRANNIYTC